MSPMYKDIRDLVLVAATISFAVFWANAGVFIPVIVSCMCWYAYTNRRPRIVLIAYVLLGVVALINNNQHIACERVANENHFNWSGWVYNPFNQSCYLKDTEKKDWYPIPLYEYMEE